MTEEDFREEIKGLKRDRIWLCVLVLLLFIANYL